MILQVCIYKDHVVLFLQATSTYQVEKNNCEYAMLVTSEDFTNSYCYCLLRRYRKSH